MSEVTKRAPRAETPRQEKKSDAEPADDKKKDEKKAEEKKAEASNGWLSKKSVFTVVALCAAFAAYKFFGSKIDVKKGIEQAVEFVEKQGTTAVLWYIAFTFVGVVCLVPTTPMEIAGGFLFHNYWGMWVYVFTGIAKLSANIVSVLIAKFVLKDWVMRTMVEKSDLLKMVSEAVKDEPWKMAFLVRGSMVPLCVKNYGLGVTEIGYLPNACCSMIFTNFYAAQNIYMGSTMSNLKEVFAPKKAAAGPQDWTATAKSLMPVVFNVLLVVCLVKALKSQMKKQTAKIKAEQEEKAKKGK